MSSRFAEEDFRKATASNPNMDCVRVARRGNRVELRDDKTAFGAADDHRIVLTSAEFDRFQACIRSGAPAGPLRLDRQADGTYLLRTATVALTFTEAEVRAFVAGIRDHEFDLAAYAPAARGTAGGAFRGTRRSSSRFLASMGAPRPDALSAHSRHRSALR